MYTPHTSIHTHTLPYTPTAQLDRDGDGVVSIDELHEILEDCNIEITRDQLQELLMTEGGLANGELVTPEVFRVWAFVVFGCVVFGFVWVGC